jgi:hypothetical protein
MGERFGPCLLYGQNVGTEEEFDVGPRWAIGYFNGEEWSVAGAVFEPTHYRLLAAKPGTPLPVRPDILKAFVEDVSNYAQTRLLGIIDKTTDAAA